MLSRQRLITTFRDGIARPYVLKPNARHVDLSNSLISLFKTSIGHRRFDIEEKIKSFNLEKTNPKVIQGLAELLFKRSAFNESSKTEAVDLRNHLFSASAAYWQSAGDTIEDISGHRTNILKKASESAAVPEIVEEYQLFGDIAANQSLSSFESITAEQLINRFNVAQVQGLLLDARFMVLSIHHQSNEGLKQLMQMLKFYRLMFTLEETGKEGFSLQIDGPGSVLENSRSYGMEMAQFFPAILLLKAPWKLTVRLKVATRRRIFKLELTNDNPYQSYLQARNVWTHEKTTALVERFNDKYGPEYQAVAAPDIVPLQSNHYLLPDFMISDETGKIRMQIEWIHYPSENRFKWLRQVKSQLPNGYVFAVRGKKAGMKQLAKTLGPHLLIYTKELTAPAVLKKFEADAR